MKFPFIALDWSSHWAWGLWVREREKEWEKRPTHHRFLSSGSHNYVLVFTLLVELFKTILQPRHAKQFRKWLRYECHSVSSFHWFLCERTFFSSPVNSSDDSGKWRKPECQIGKHRRTDFIHKAGVLHSKPFFLLFYYIDLPHWPTRALTMR